MSTPQVETGRGAWNLEGHPWVVEYSLAALNEIGADAVEGLYRLRRGGVEIGGALFGTREPDRIRVTAYRPLACEYAFGPTFLLSERDFAALKALLGSAKDDAALHSLEPLGWYHSHTRTGIALSIRDLEVFERFFPEPWQVALVIQPAHFGPSRGGFFVREKDGSLQAESCHREFLIEPPRRANKPALPDGQASAPANSPRQRIELPPEAVGEAAQPDREPQSSTFEVTEEPPVLGQVQAARRTPWKWLSAFAGIALLACGAWFGWEYLPAMKSNDTVTLRVLDADGQLFIEWDRNAKAIRQVRGAALEIQDGEDLTIVPLDAPRVLLGSVTYKRRSEYVDIRFRAAGRPVGETVRFIGQPVPYKPTPQEVEVTRERDQLRKVNESLRAELELARKDSQVQRLQRQLASAGAKTAAPATASKPRVNGMR
jgi:proteasome lid subunit RPN8/RPN11